MFIIIHLRKPSRSKYIIYFNCCEHSTFTIILDTLQNSFRFVRSFLWLYFDSQCPAEYLFFSEIIMKTCATHKILSNVYWLSVTVTKTAALTLRSWRYILWKKKMLKSRWYYPLYYACTTNSEKPEPVAVTRKVFSQQFHWNGFFDKQRRFSRSLRTDYNWLRHEEFNAISWSEVRNEIAILISFGLIYVLFSRLFETAWSSLIQMIEFNINYRNSSQRLWVMCARNVNTPYSHWLASRKYLNGSYFSCT